MITFLICLVLQVDPSGVVIVIGFSDGILRAVTVDLNENCSEDRVQLIQLIKPHSKGITKLSINMKETILVSGSEDGTIFVHKLIKGTPYVSLLPISLVNISAVPTVISWHPFSVREFCKFYFNLFLNIIFLVPVCLALQSFDWLLPWRNFRGRIIGPRGIH
jgi:WD40 repeat protein